MITVSKEDYLKAILEAESEGETVISATLAHWLSVSPPAVTMALRRLKKDGLVRVGRLAVLKKLIRGIVMVAADDNLRPLPARGSGEYQQDKQ